MGGGSGQGRVMGEMGTTVIEQQSKTFEKGRARVTNTTTLPYNLIFY